MQVPGWEAPTIENKQMPPDPLCCSAPASSRGPLQNLRPALCFSPLDHRGNLSLPEQPSVRVEQAAPVAHSLGADQLLAGGGSHRGRVQPHQGEEQLGCEGRPLLRHQDERVHLRVHGGVRGLGLVFYIN